MTATASRFALPGGLRWHTGMHHLTTLQPSATR
jgi:hypothetical protein